MTEEKSYENHLEENKKAFDQVRQEVWSRNAANLESNDKAILTLSSTGLAVTLGFFSKIVDIPNAILMPMIYTSWALYCVSVIMVVFSFHMANVALKKYSERMEYLLDPLVDEEPEKTFAEKFPEYLNYFSSIAFIFALVLSVTFFILNFRNSHSLKKAPQGMSIKQTIPPANTIDTFQGEKSMPTESNRDTIGRPTRPPTTPPQTSTPPKRTPNRGITPPPNPPKKSK